MAKKKPYQRITNGPIEKITGLIPSRYNALTYTVF